MNKLYLRIEDFNRYVWTLLLRDYSFTNTFYFAYQFLNKLTDFKYKNNINQLYIYIPNSIYLSSK